MIQTRRPDFGSVAQGCIALIIGMGIGYVDSRPGWDDSGITAMTLLLGGTALAFRRPSLWWLWALLVGFGTPALNLATGGGVGSIAAVAFALIGAGLGALARTLIRPALR
jgi:hypothetical protein